MRRRGARAGFSSISTRTGTITRELVQRAEAAGAEAIVLTVDAPGLGTRERDMRNSFRLPDGLAVENLAPLGKGDFPEVRGSGLAAYVRANFKEDLGFDDLDWLCRSTRLPVVVKGVCRGDDARRAAEHGAKAVVVSNHGGRQLDTAPATCEVLPHVVEAVGDLCEIYVDGGIRRGSDVLKAIALGARAVLVGRPILWGLCVAGEEGALQVSGNSATRARRSDAALRLYEAQRGRWNVVAALASSCRRRHRIEARARAFPAEEDGTVRNRRKELSATEA